MQVALGSSSCELKGQIRIDRMIESLEPIEHQVELSITTNRIKVSVYALEFAQKICRSLNSAEYTMGKAHIDLILSGCRFTVEPVGNDLLEFDGLLEGDDTIVVAKARLISCLREIATYSATNDTQESAHATASVKLLLKCLLDRINALAGKLARL